MVERTVTLTAAESENPLVEDGRRDARMARPPQKRDNAYLTGYRGERQQMGHNDTLALTGAGSDSIGELIEEAFHTTFQN